MNKDINNRDRIEHDHQHNIRAYESRDMPPSTRVVYYEQEEDVHLIDYINIIRKRKLFVIIFFLSVFTTVTLATFMAIPLYKSTAVIKIDKESPQILAFKDVQIDRPDADYYETQYKILKSRALARLVIKKLNLHENKDFIPAQDELTKIKDFLIGAAVNFVEKIADKFTGPESGENLEGMEEIPLDNHAYDVHAEDDGIRGYHIGMLLSRLEVIPVKNSRLVNVSFESHNPRLSMEVANAVADNYIEFDLQSRIDANRGARRFLERQIDIVKAKVETSEEELNKYSSKNEMILLDKDRDNSSLITKDLSQLSVALNEAVTNRLQKEALYKEVQESGTENQIFLSNSLIGGLKRQYADLKAEYLKLSNIYRPEYPEMKSLEEQMNSILNSIEQEKKSIIRSIESEYNLAVKREKYLRQAFNKQKSLVLDFQEKTVQYQILRREVDANKELYNSLLQRLKEVGVSATKTVTNIQVLDRAELPKVPFKPNKVFNILLSIVFGLMGGIGLAFLIEYFDNTVNSSNEIEKRMHLPALGIIPYQKGLNSKKRPMIAYSTNTSPIAEAFRSVSTFILLSSSSRRPKTILITSPGEKEGKSTVSINTAMALSESLGNGVIVDADLRKPKLHNTFEVDNTHGLSTFLSGNIDFGNGLIKPTSIKGLGILTAGPTPPNPSELIVSSRMNDLLDALYSVYNFVVIDSVPVMGMPESVFLSSITDGTVLVIKAGETPKKALNETRKIFRNVNAKLIGVVLNGVKEKDFRYGYYSSYYSSYFKGSKNNS